MTRVNLRFAKQSLREFHAIRDGVKTVETRAATVAYQDIKAGDVLALTCASEKFEKTVKAVKHFASVKELFTEVPVEQVFPDLHTIEEAEKVYYSFAGYKEKIARHGLLAFYL